VSLAFRATSRTLAAVVQVALKGTPELAGLFTAGDLRVYVGSPETAGRGVHVWLYLVTANDAARDRPLPATGPQTMPARLHYLVTPVVDDDPETEQLILASVMQSLHERPVLSGSDLQDELAGTGAIVRVLPAVVPLEAMTQLWRALGTRYRTSVAYEVTVTAEE